MKSQVRSNLDSFSVASEDVINQDRIISCEYNASSFIINQDCLVSCRTETSVCVCVCVGGGVAVCICVCEVDSQKCV